jgi:hypothetical protein
MMFEDLGTFDERRLKYLSRRDGGQTPSRYRFIFQPYKNLILLLFQTNDRVE